MAKKTITMDDPVPNPYPEFQDEVFELWRKRLGSRGCQGRGRAERLPSMAHKERDQPRWYYLESCPDRKAKAPML